MHGQMLAISCLPCNANKYVGDSELLLRGGVIDSTGGESEENRIGKGFTNEMPPLVACLGG